MPLIRIDYNSEKLVKSKAQELVTCILESSKRIFKTDDDKVSIFSKKYDSIDFSTAAAEIELRAKLAEFEHSSLSKDEVREQFMQAFEKDLGEYIKRNELQSGIVFTITFEDWKVIWLPPAN